MDRTKNIFLILTLNSFFKKKLHQKKRRFKRWLFLLCRLNIQATQRILFLNNLGILLSRSLCDRRFWRHDRRDHWFNSLMENRHLPEYQDRWRSLFRLSTASFEHVVNLVRPLMLKRNTNFRQAIPIEQRVAIALWRLATGSTMKTTAEALSVGASTVTEICNEFCECLCNFSEQYIAMPDGRETAERLMQLFKLYEDCQIPMVIGAVDGTHIPIIAPRTENKVDYFNRKQRYSMNTQAIVGGNSIFLAVSTGFPGSIHDSRALRNSFVFSEIENGAILNEPITFLQNTRIGPNIIGDSAYPMKKWLITPFANPQTLGERRFNRELSKCRSSVERAFGVLKCRWRCLNKKLESDITNVSTVILSCFILHNICQLHGDLFDFNDELEEILENERRINGRRPYLAPQLNPRNPAIVVRNALLTEFELNN